MKKLMFVVVSLGLAMGSVACKKDEKKGDESAKKVEGDPKAPDKTDPGKAPAPGTGSVAATNAPAPTGTAPAGDGLKLEWKGPAVGSKQESTDDLVTKMTLTVGPGQNMDMVMTKSEQTHTEFVEVNPEGQPTKLKVHYAKQEETQAMGGKTQTKPSPIAGNAYVVWIEGDEFKATKGDGAEVSPEELEELEDDHKKDLGKVPGIAQVLLGKTWKQGEKVSLTADELKTLAMGGEDDKMQPASATVTLAGVDGGIATFEMDMLGVMEDPEGKMEVPMKVTVKLDVANVRPTEIAMTGTLGGKVKGMDTKGTLEGKKTFTYQ